jgi:hypothetical protein
VGAVSHPAAKLMFMTNRPGHQHDDRDHDPRRIPHAADAGSCCCGHCGDRDQGAPFGLPVLEDVPELAGLLEDLTAIDRLVVRVIDALMLAEDTSLSETATGLPIERWLAGLAGRTRSDRKMLQTAAQACRRLPGIHAEFRAGRISWAQLRAIALRIQRLPRQHDQDIDVELTQAIGLAGTRPDPDSLLCVISQVLDAHHPPTGDGDRPQGAPEADFLAMQPRLDGSGGRLYGDFGPQGFAAIDNRLSPDKPAGPSRDGFGHDADAEKAEATGRQLAQSRAQKLIELCTTNRGDGTPTPASYVVRLDVETLLRLAPDKAATLLTTMTGGRLWLDAETARALADRHGTTLRLVLRNQGRVVGIGRKTEKVPGWLAEATLAIHDTCTAPGCQVAARVCDTDHAVPFSGDGRTDIDNLAPVCATDNRAKEPAGWRCHHHPDGRRTWTHKASGLTTTTLPSTWTPPDQGHAPPRDGDDGHGPPRAGEDRAPPGAGDCEDRGPPLGSSDGDRGPPSPSDGGHQPPSVADDDLPF